MNGKHKFRRVTLDSLSYPFVKGVLKVAIPSHAITIPGGPNPTKILGTYIIHGKRREDPPQRGAKKIFWVGNGMKGAVFYFPDSAKPKTEGIR